MQRHCFKALAQVAAGRLRQERRIAPHYWKLHRAETGTQTGQRLGLALLGQHWSPPQPTGFGHARKWLMQNENRRIYISALPRAQATRKFG